MKMIKVEFGPERVYHICENCYNGNHMSYGFDHTKFSGRTENFPVSDCKNIGRHPDTGEIIQCHCGFPEVWKQSNIVYRLLKLADQLDKKSEYPYADTIEKRIEDLKDITKIQCSQGNWDYDDYMQGLANGMILGLATIEGKEPEYKSAPERWLFYNDKEAVLKQLLRLVDVLNEKGLNTEANKIAQLRRTYDYNEGFYSNMDKYKSVKDFRKKRKRLSSLDCIHENTVKLVTEGLPIEYCVDCNQVVTENKLNRGDWDKDYIPTNVSPYNDIGSPEAKPIDKSDFYS